MAINSNVCKGKPERLPEFPKLGRRELDGAVVLFSDPGSGTVVSGGVYGGFTVGYFYDGWNMAHFTDFEGSVTLSNK